MSDELPQGRVTAPPLNTMDQSYKSAYLMNDSAWQTRRQRIDTRLRALAGEAITELEAVVDDLREIVALVEKEEGVEK